MWGLKGAEVRAIAGTLWESRGGGGQGAGSPWGDAEGGSGLGQGPSELWGWDCGGQGVAWGSREDGAAMSDHGGVGG